MKRLIKARVLFAFRMMLLMCLENFRSVVNRTPKSVSSFVEEIVSLKELVCIV